MRQKNWSISIWLLTGFSIILAFVLLLGINSYNQTKELSLQTQTMYNHPLTVRRAIDNLQLDIAEMRLQFRNYILFEDEKDKEAAIELLEVAAVDIDRQIAIIEDRYLGPEEDVQNIKEAYILWEMIRDDNVDLASEGEIDDVLISISDNGEEGIKRTQLLESIKIIDVYAQNKSDELFENSQSLHQSMEIQLIVIVSTAFLLTIVIGYILYRSFKVPLAAMNEAINLFEQGDMSKRLEIDSAKELNLLSESINKMADTIEANDKLQSITNDFADVLISENEIERFFSTVLKSLMEFTNAVSSVIYLKNEHSDDYHVFESIGMDKKVIKQMSNVFSFGEIEHLKTYMKPRLVTLDVTDERFVYNTLSGGVIPKEVMNIPLMSGNNLNAIISLATISSFSEESMLIIEQIIDNLTSRSEAILATNKINDFILELEQRSNELVSQNAELELQKKQLNQASKLKSNFMSNMSHELRTPLNSVIALSGVLHNRLKGKLTDEEYSYIEIIGRNGRNLLNLINDILDISRIESGRMEIDVTTFNVNQVISEIYSVLKIKADEKHITFKHENKKGQIFVKTDYDKCLHIIQNLVSNAIKFTESGSVIIETKSENGNFDVIVRDTGIGISESQMEVIFEEFKQAESGTSRRFGGTGLGLSIAKKYANMLEGDVFVTSVLGEGSTFTLRLPKEFKGDRIIVNNAIDAEEITVAPVKRYEETSDQIYDKTVLLVEDNESAVIQIQDLVQGMGVKLLVANDGESGLELSRTNNIDGIILDLMMPGLDGFSVLEKVRNEDLTADVPVLVLSAKHITKNDLKKLKRNNIYQLVQKGDVDRIELQKSIFNMLFISKEKTKKISRTFKPKILIVEDNSDNRITLRALLSDFGEIIEAEDGEIGINKAIEHKPDLILMDIDLPKKNGVEAFHEIRKNKDIKQPPIIAITASVLEEERSSILSHGFNGFVAKPIIKDDLMSAIERVLFND